MMRGMSTRPAPASPDALHAAVATHEPGDSVKVAWTDAAGTKHRATLKLGQARGIAMLVPALLGVSIAEYAPNAIKKTVVVVDDHEVLASTLAMALGAEDGLDVVGTAGTSSARTA